MEQSPPPGTAQPAATVAETKTSGMAVTSMVLGIVGLVLGLLVIPLICSILAIIFGVVARNQIKNEPHLKGNGMAIAGLVMGIAGLVLYGALIAIGAAVG